MDDPLSHAWMIFEPCMDDPLSLVVLCHCMVRLEGLSTVTVLLKGTGLIGY